MNKHNKPDARFFLVFASWAVQLLRKGACDSPPQGTEKQY